MSHLVDFVKFELEIPSNVTSPSMLVSYEVCKKPSLCVVYCHTHEHNFLSRKCTETQVI